VSNLERDSWAGVLASQRAAKVEARLRAWRVVLGVFAAIWMLPTLAALVGWNVLFFPLALIAAANACAAFVGFDRYGNLIVGLAVIAGPALHVNAHTPSWVLARWASHANRLLDTRHDLDRSCARGWWNLLAGRRVPGEGELVGPSSRVFG
jgi:hypothetical protein